MADDLEFDEAFRALTGNDPFPWQHAMYRRIVTGDPPKSCQIPTGLGKTSVMAIWLIALAEDPNRVPRRLVYVVNRRTVVDQATREAEDLRAKLDALPELGRKFGRPAISTLRGQFQDNREWSADPSRPAIIVGTVDMIGSRLLFSGYGIGFKSKPLHAGFLGQDVLLVHDEAHLEPAFQELLGQIVNEQRKSNDLRPIRVMELSATSRDGESFQLTDEDRANPRVKRRIEAKKAIVLHPNQDPKKLADQLAELALQHKNSNSAVLVFARTVETVEDVAKKLRKVKPHDVETLTGTMRGLERDGLMGNAVFKRFLPNPEPNGQTVYLVCTSAGEVGVNISADHLVCDLTTFESMAQRFGRVNRFGDRDDTRIDVVHPVALEASNPYEGARAKTLELLEALRGDGSSAALDLLELDQRRDAFAPEPDIFPVSDILFDAWALTSIRGELPGRPPVEPYLHGKAEWEPPETRVAWREDVEYLSPLFTPEELAELLDDYPIKPHELLKDRSSRVFDRLASLAKGNPDKRAWLLDDDGTIRVGTLKDLANKDAKDQIENLTVLLPPSAGGLKGGMLTGNPDDISDQADVSDEWLDQKQRRRRYRFRSNTKVPPDLEATEEMRLIRVIDTRPEEEDDSAEVEGDKSDGSSGRYWYWYERLESPDDDMSKTSRRPVRWGVHTKDVTERARRIVGGLSLLQDLAEAVILAAEFHDLGKRRVVWQRSIGNPKPTEWLAKSGGKMKPLELNGYRHEFGSLVDVQREPEFRRLSIELKELVLHLIAAHHGLGRPHFPPDQAFDPDSNGKDVDAVAAETPRRFAQLQRRYGRWGLAYLESLLRAADYAASASPSAFLGDKEDAR